MIIYDIKKPHNNNQIKWKQHQQKQEEKIGTRYGWALFTSMTRQSGCVSTNNNKKQSAERN